MRKDKTISSTTIRRLTKYYRYIDELDLKISSMISSYTLGKMMNDSPSLIRQDFNTIGSLDARAWIPSSNFKKKLAIWELINTYMVVVGAGKSRSNPSEL